MNLYFDRRPGEIYDVLSSLWFIDNYDYVKEEAKKKGTELDKKREEIIFSIINSKKIDMKKLDRYFNNDIAELDIFSISDMWNTKTIDEYVDFIKNIDSKEIRKKIINSLTEDIDNINKICKDNDSVLNYIKDRELNAATKWEIFCMLNDTKNYFHELSDFLMEYLETYKAFEKERKKQVNKLTNNLEENIKEYGLEFLKKQTKGIVNLDDYENIYVTTSFMVGFLIKIDEVMNSCYIILSPRSEEFLEKMSGVNEIEKNLNIFKNLSDNTRFQIIKLLVSRDYYGQEIAQAIGITTATVSYHMNYLFAAGLIHVEKKDHKAYYSLNKDVLRNSMKFLHKELEL